MPCLLLEKEWKWLAIKTHLPRMVQMKINMRSEIALREWIFLNQLSCYPLRISYSLSSPVTFGSSAPRGVADVKRRLQVSQDRWVRRGQDVWPVVSASQPWASSHIWISLCRRSKQICVSVAGWHEKLMPLCQSLSEWQCRMGITGATRVVLST